MRKDERRHAERQAQQREKRHKYHAQNNLRNHNGQHRKVFHGAFGAQLYLGKTVGAQRAHRGGAKAGRKRQHKAVAKRLEHGAVAKQRFVPPERKAAPHTADLAFVERIQNDKHDGQIQNNDDKAEIQVRQPGAVFHSRPSSSVVCVTRLYSEIIRLVSTISTTLSAAANGQLCAFIS